MDTKMYKYIVYSIIWLFIFSSCTENNLIEYNYPHLTTLEVSGISEEGVTLNAQVEKTKNVKIIEQGFIWGDPAFVPSMYDSASIYETSNTKNFSLFIDFALPDNKEVAYYAFAITKEHKVIGNMKTFMSMGSKPVVIENYEPKRGSDKEIITITGDNFSMARINYEILFGSFKGKIISATKNQLLVGVPEDYDVPGKVQLKIKIFQNEYLVGDFDLDSLKLINVQPKEAYIAKTILKITTNKNIKSIAELKIGQIEIASTNIIVEGNIMSFVVPPNTPAGQFKISGVINNKPIESDLEVKYISPWTRKEDSPEMLSHRITNSGFSYNGKAIYNVPLGKVIPDENRGGNHVFWEYNPELDDWKKIAETSQEDGIRSYMMSFALNNLYYWGAGLLWGHDENNFNIYEFNPASKSNKRIPSFRNLLAPTDYTPQIMSPYSVGLGNYGYVFGGEISTVYPELPFYKYSQTKNSWEKLESLNNSVDFKYWSAMSGFEINGKIYIGTGLTDNGPINKFWCYDPQADSWSEIAKFPGKTRAFAIGFTIEGKGYIGLGSSNKNIYFYQNKNLYDIWEYDPQTNRWEEVANFPGGGRPGATVVVVNKKAYVCFGNEQNDLWEFSTNF